MKLGGGRIDAYLSAPPSDSLGVLVYGPDRGLVSERAKTIRNALCANPDNPFSVTQLSADDLSSDPARLMDEIQAQSLLGDSPLVRLILNHEKNGQTISKMIKTLDANPKICAGKLIVEAGDLSPRSPMRKIFEAAKNFAALPCYADTILSLSNLVKDTLAEHKMRIDRDALDAYLPLLAGDRALARAELEKLVLYMGAGRNGDVRISIFDIRAIAAGAGASKIDDIIFDTMSGKLGPADHGLRRAFDAKTTPPAVLIALQRHLTRLHQASVLIGQGQSADDAMRALRPPVFVMRKQQFLNQLRIWTSMALKRAMTQSLETEKAMKTAASPAEALMGRLVLALSSYAQKRGR